MACTSIDGPKIGSTGDSMPETCGSLAIWPRRPDIWESPAGVNASPRKSSVTTLTSPDSPKLSSIAVSALVIELPLGSASAVS